MAAEDPLTILLSHLGPAASFTSQITSFASQAFNLASPLLTLLSKATHTTTTANPDGTTNSSISPELINTALLLFILYLSIKIVSIASRWMFGFVFTIIRYAFFMVVLLVGLSIYTGGMGTVMHFLEMVGAGGLVDSLNTGAGTAGGATFEAGGAGRAGKMHRQGGSGSGRGYH